MHWAHAITAANNYSVGLITLLTTPKSHPLIHAGTAVGRSASQIQTYSSAARPKSDIPAKPRTKTTQHNMALSPHAPDVQRQKDRKGETALFFTAVSHAQPHLYSRLPKVSPFVSPREERQHHPRLRMRKRGVGMDKWS